MVDATRDGSPAVRQYGAIAARKLDVSKAIAPLTRALQDPDKNVRATAATSLGSFGSKAASHSKALESAIAREQDSDVRAALGSALEAIKGKQQ